MVIKNPDGSIYQLKKPNPLLKSQDLSDPTHIVHNFNAEEFIIRYKTKKIIPNSFPADIGKLEPLPILPQQPVAPDPIIPPEPVVIEEEYEEETNEVDNKVSCWCLPGDWKKYRDTLYDETRTNAVWGDKFMFDGIVLDMNEMNYQIWTQIKINPPSIIFTRAERRWWKVMEVNPESDGFTMTCMPSDTRPRFD